MARFLLLLRGLFGGGVRRGFAALMLCGLGSLAWAEGTVPGTFPANGSQSFPAGDAALHAQWLATCQQNRPGKTCIVDTKFFAPGVSGTTMGAAGGCINQVGPGVCTEVRALGFVTPPSQWGFYVDLETWVQGAGMVCGPNSVLAGGSCACNTGFSPGTGALSGLCVPPTNCPSGSTYSSGWYDIGKDITAFQMGACVGGCAYTYDGFAATKTQLVGGVKHYFAQGSYTSTGTKCGAGDGDPGNAPPPPAAAPEVPPATCPSGQAPGSVDRGSGPEKVCVPVGAASSASSPQPAASGVPDAPKDTTSCTSSTAGTVTTKTCTTTYANGSTGVTTTTNDTATGATSTTNSGANVGGSGSGGSTPGSGPGSPMSPGNAASGAGGGGGGPGGCSSNPSAAGCGGVGSGIGAGYEAKDKTVGGVLAEKRDQFLASGIGAATSSFWTVDAAGTCPVSTWRIEYFDANIPFDVMCSQWALDMLGVMRVVVLLVFAWYAFRICLD